MSRFSSTAGIAIGPILFVIALLGILAAVFAAGTSSFGVATMADRVTADINSQANLIRSKINECYMQSIANNVDNSAAPCAGDTYPCSDQTDGTLVVDLTCPGDSLVDSAQQNVWTGPRNALLPPPTSGFTPWRYMNAGASGGRCFWTQITGSKNGGVVSGLVKVASKFSSQEISYDENSDTQKFVVFLTTPAGAVDSHCTVP
ncbi:MAG: hypothetical protein PHY92_06650 [Alphaproteobacteria bacterium]|nr:hypothetical protein [Alphaproteobacteria bacterium]